jgi:hypothetical protein
MSNVRDTDIPDLVAGVVNDARALVEAQVSSLKSDLGDRLGDRGTAIKSWLIALCVADVAQGRLVSKDFSSSVPIDTNDTVAGRENNRRVEFVVSFTILNDGSPQ